MPKLTHSTPKYRKHWASGHGPQDRREHDGPEDRCSPVYLVMAPR